MNTPKITVIIPVYNTEKYLGRCLDSVKRQTFKDIEILCINDGSTDGTAGILRRYSSEDGRIRVVDLPENHGVPYARNLAMDLAKGEYVYFLDSDDWIDPDYLEEMLSHALRTGQDVVINGNWYIEYDDPSKTRRCDRFGFIHEEPGFYSPVRVQSYFFPVVWARLYKLKYLKDNDIRAPLLKGGVEDNYFTSLAEILQKESYIFNGPFYHYYQREGSLVRQKDVHFNHFRNFRVFLDTLRQRGIPPEAARRYYAMDSITIDSEEMFDFLHAYFADVEPDVVACPNLYSNFDAFTLKAVLSCPDYASFLKRYTPKLFMSFRVKVYRFQNPSTQEILDGTWKL